MTATGYRHRQRRKINRVFYILDHPDASREWTFRHPLAAPLNEHGTPIRRQKR